MLRRLRDSAGGVDQLSIASTCLYGGSDTSRLRDLVGLSRGLGIPLLATNGVLHPAVLAALDT